MPLSTSHCQMQLPRPADAAPGATARSGAGQEARQSRVRLVFAAVLGVACAAWLLLHDARSAWVAAPFAVYPILALLHGLHVRRYPRYNPLRHLLVVLLDHAGATVWAYLMGPAGALVLFVYLWVTIGNGLRFGVRWLAISAAVAIAALLLLGLLPGYWRAYPLMLAGMALTNVMAPWYLHGLLTRLELAQRELEAHTQNLETAVHTDGLTGIANRPAIFAALEQIPPDGRGVAALLYFDLDGFKRVNDTYGHATGDALLQKVAREVGSVLRGSDLFARVGGDEFIVLLAGAAAPSIAAHVAERVLAQVHGITEVDGKPVAVSASIGLVTFDPAMMRGHGVETLIHEADQNMYSAKRAGKNTVIRSALGAHCALDAR